MPVAEDKFMRNLILSAKENQVSWVSKENFNSYSLITKSLETKFGEAKHFIDNRRNENNDSKTT